MSRPRRTATGVTRRRFLRAAGGLTAGPALVGCDRQTYRRHEGAPNILLITADDLGWKDLACYGNPNVATPHLDRLAREGARFTHAFGVTSSCSPARATFITGQYPHTHGVTGLTHKYVWRSLPPWRDTLPSLLAAAGHDTALEGKWHVAPYCPTSWYGYQERLSGVFADAMWIRDSTRTIEFLQRNRDHRFYLELNYMNTHRDHAGDFAFAPDFPIDPEGIRVPPYLHLPDWPEIRADLARFYSRVAHMDHLVGETLTALDALGLADRTLVIFVSDNGAPWPGNKMTLYDRGIGTPLILRWPGRNLAGDPGVGAVRTALQAHLARHLQATGDRLDAPVRPGVTPPRP